jgi:hypothetical protein
MAFYVYVPNNPRGGGGYVSDAFDDAHDAACEQATIGGDARIIEAPKPSYRHLYALKEKGWRKCETCGRPTPPWAAGAGPKPASESGSGK